ncbi:MAG: hypothetical protein Q3974_07270 [Rothia sp. (in: high G+C Gram-positive bacteria)]|nr:hypothetical protein [Rothia sp. (in: high G+C Gram-positive bacteria)]
MKSPKNIGTAFVSAVILMGLTPGLAQATPTTSIPMNPNAGITKLWQKNPDLYGKPVYPEKCVTGKGCEQVFEKAVLTWNSRNGVKALTGAAKVAAFEKAGGVATVGALEGDSWNNTFCGPVVTTWDGKTRHLVVVGDSKATAGSSIDLNSSAGKDWLATRSATNACFPAEEAPVPPGTNHEIPANLNWSQAFHSYQGDTLILQTETTAYVTKADENYQPLAGATVFEVPLLAKPLNNLSTWYNSYDNAALQPEAALGMPLANPVWGGASYTQQFEGGTESFNAATGEHKTFISIEGAKTYAKSINMKLPVDAGGYQGNFQKIDADLYAERGNFYTFIYDSRQGIFGIMDNRAFDVFLEDTHQFGTFAGSSVVGDGRGGDMYNYGFTNFIDQSGYEVTVSGFKTKSVNVIRTNADGTWITEIIDREPEWVPMDPATVDWSKAYHIYRDGIPGQNESILFMQDGPASSLIIKANADGTPQAGAMAYRSDWLGYFQPRSGRWDITDFSLWSEPTPAGSLAPQYFLGAPIEDGKTVVENGVTFQTQRFEHGAIKWEVPVGDAKAKDAVVTLDAETQALYNKLYPVR